MKEAQQLRWAKIRGDSKPSSTPVTPEPVKPKRKLTAAGKANIVAALRKRLAAKKAAAVKMTPLAAKKSAAKTAPVKKAAKKAAKKKTARAPVKVEAQPTV